MLFNFSILFFTNFMSVFRRTHKKACLSAHEHICSNATQACVCVSACFMNFLTYAAPCGGGGASVNVIWRTLQYFIMPKSCCSPMRSYAHARIHTEAYKSGCAYVQQFDRIEMNFVDYYSFRHFALYAHTHGLFKEPLLRFFPLLLQCAYP